MITSNGVKIHIEYSEEWEEKLAKALLNLHVRIEKKVASTKKVIQF